MPHWSEAYTTREYIAGAYDCGSLVEDIQRDVFARNIVLPKERSDHDYGYGNLLRYAEMCKAITAGDTTVLAAVETPIEGDIVVMRTNARINHVGVYTVIGDVPYVVHTLANRGVCVHGTAEFGSGLLKNLTIESWHRPQ